MNAIAVLRRLNRWGPVLFGIGLIAPFTAQALDAAEMSAPLGMGNVPFGLAVGVAVAAGFVLAVVLAVAAGFILGFGVTPFAAIAVARQWLEWAPPQVITMSDFCARASARTNSSLRILLPDRAAPVRSSRLTYRSTPNFLLKRRRGCIGVGNLARSIWGGNDRLHVVIV